MTPEERFWSKVDRRSPDECWPWLGATCGKDKRGRLYVNGRDIYAHRFSLSLKTGVMPSSDVCACHTCDNGNCVNPNHLWWGTHRENMIDCSDKNRHVQSRKTHCPKGHPYDEGNTKGRSNRRRSRECRICVQETKRKYRESLKGKRFMAAQLNDDLIERVAKAIHRSLQNARIAPFDWRTHVPEARAAIEAMQPGQSLAAMSQPTDEVGS